MSNLFKEIKKSEIIEQKGILHEYVHAASGARLFYLETKDDNKLFSVTFKTVPENSTGVFHILEHSVLCGSKKYPVKDPFLQLAKGSMNTFLNAMTFPDHTSYPVSSRNEKDFHNLVAVYLDAVFHPAIYENKSIFHQEGWHYEVTEDGESAFVNGVVFNEMKGVESSVDEKLHAKLMEMLYPDTCYHFVSGGRTDEIPSLSYEKFLETHRRLYRPDNAIFYLEGNLDLKAALSQIEDYLYVKTEASDIPEINMQDEISNSTSTITYPLGEDESMDNKVHIYMGKRLCEFEDRKKIYAAMILSDYMTSSLDSPLTQNILANQLGQDVQMMVDNGIKQPYMYIHVVNTESSHETEIKELMAEIRDFIIESGCLREGLEPIITNLEFRNREIEEPRALIHSMNVTTSALYGVNAAEFLTYNDLFKELRELLSTDYYEKLLIELLSPENLSTVIATPVYENDESNITIVPVTEEMIIDNQKLYDWQMTPDSAEAIDSLPRLELSDIDLLPRESKYKELEKNGVKILLHEAPISDMAYLNMYFPVPAEYASRLSEVSLLGNLLLNLPTEKYDPMSLYQKMKSLVGDLTFEFVSAADIMNCDDSITYLSVRTSYLKDSAKDTIELISEVLYHTQFEDEAYAESILAQLSDAFRNETIENGHSLGMVKALSSFKSANGAVELTEGLSCYEAIKTILGTENGINDFLVFMDELSKKVFTRQELILGITVPEGDDFLQYGVDEMLSSIPSGELKECIMHIKLPREDKTIQIPANISYATAGIYSKPDDIKQIGVRRVAANIISLEYLWSEIRMRGGAYGAGMGAGMDGNISFYSYRDPNPDNSRNTYRQCAEFLKEFSKTEAELETYIIGAVSNSEPLLSPKNEAYLAEKDYLNGLSYSRLCDVREGMLETSWDDVIEFAEELEVLKDGFSECIIRNSKS